jgi:hypothetical protein
MIGKAFHFFAVRPAMAIGTQLKRRPYLVLLLLIVLWFLPSPSQMLGGLMVHFIKLATQVAGVLLRFLPERWVVVFARFVNWVAASPACGLALLVLPFVPMLGFALAAWCVTDRIKAALNTDALPPNPVKVEGPQG